MTNDRMREIAHAFRDARAGLITPEEAAIRATADNPTALPTVAPALRGWLRAQWRAAGKGKMTRADLLSLARNRGSSDV